jgi:hypothetical protein
MFAARELLAMASASAAPRLRPTAWMTILLSLGAKVNEQ